LEVTADLTNCPNLFIPDGFSPNDDGLNDTFYIKNIDVLFPNFSLEIYNRYGNVVYTGNINTPNFNGKSNKSTMIGNEILPTGVYFYILHYNDSQGKKPTQGRLYLSR
jgi:gliding motility-associated-like protein